ncbi:Phage virion morphogensis protein [uncultured Caudovirales phage]|uniref:Phage virion morphogensis protein n=1 Tax=uncultured Caudovirales phage TaxID=2100421 RepID=A0A6J5P323_9CAUD|nr:Phage virion morphogensis protein [uncultured Caudovirales phage]
MINLSLQFQSNALTQKLRQLQGLVGNSDTPNRAIATQLYGWTIRNFNSRGNEANGTPWAPLRPSTVRYKEKIGKQQMLVITGNLRQSFAGFSDANAAGVGARASAFKGSRGDYARYLHEGTIHMPPRNLLPTEKAALDIGIRVYDLFISRAIAK